MKSEPWRTWSVYDWSDRLLDHFFLRSSAQAGAVTNLVISPTEFERLTGDGHRDGEEILEAFTARIIQSAKADGLWNQADKNSRMQDGRPRFLAYLIFACLVAVDTEDPDEGSYLRRLDEAVGSDSGHGIERMAELWQKLAAWLDEDGNKSAYRPIQLPDPGGWTRIGHTIKLAFPTRRDQLLLARVLDGAGLAQEDPPPGPVFAALDSSRERFSPRLEQALADAREAWVAEASLEDLGRSPLWAAVRGACELRLSDVDTPRARWTLLAEDDELDLDLRLVTDDANSEDTVESGAELWPGEASAESLVALLDGGRSPSAELTAAVRGGVLPFTENSDGDYVLASKSDLDHVSTVVVRDDLLPEFIDRYAGRSGEYAHDKWSVVRGCTIATVSSDELAGSGLANTYLLHTAPSAIRVVFNGGIRVGGGFLGRARSLPAVAGAALAGLISNGERGADLIGESSGRLLIPDEYAGPGLVGDHSVLVEYPNGTALRKVDFVSSPAAEKFKFSSDMTCWVAAGAIGCRRFEPTEAPQPPLIEDSTKTVYLGRDVGEFVTERSDAAWAVVEFGGERLLYQLAEDVLPRAEVDHSGACRRWRKLLRGARRADGGSDHQQRAGARAFGLPKTSANEAVSAIDAASPKPAKDHPGLAAAIDVLVALANRRAGLRFRPTIALLQDQLGLDDSQVWMVLDMWEDAGMISPAATTRWTNRIIWPTQPSLVTFRADRLFGARLTGLTLDTTTAHATDVAKSLGLAICMQRSESGLLPPTLTVRSHDEETIIELGARCGIAVQSAAVDPESREASDARSEPVTGHELRRVVQLPNHDGSISRWAHRKGPTRWEAKGSAGSMWFYSRRSAIFAASALESTPAVLRHGVELRSCGPRLPFPLATAANLVAPLAAGPDRDFTTYRYWFETTEMASRIETEASELAATIRDRSKRQTT